MEYYLVVSTASEKHIPRNWLLWKWSCTHSCLCRSVKSIGHIGPLYFTLKKLINHSGAFRTSPNWLVSYLKFQFVQFGDVISDEVPISTGVPQGSIFVLLFIFYINDIHRGSDTFNAILYADDTNLIGNVCSFKYTLDQFDTKYIKH